MFRLFSPESARKAIESESAFIRRVAEKYALPAAWIQAILLKEMTELNLSDRIADDLVRFYYWRYHLTGRTPRSGNRLLGKKDSSTGWGQIFGFVAIHALNNALDHRLATYAELGIESDHRLDRENPDDLWMIWSRLNRDRHFNIEVCALNLLSCAEEMNGHADVLSFTDEETRRTFTRYNADVRHVTRYGEETHHYYQEYRKQEL